LAIAQNLVQLHGGTLAAHSEGPQRGSRFSMRLPRMEDLPAAEQRPASSVRAGSRPARILIVDDNEDAANALAMLLQLEGHEVRTAPHGDAALAMLEAYVPELALLDIGLPGMDGYQLARALRAHPRSRHTRLVALTGYGLENDRRQAMEAGFDQHLIKPVDLELLLRTLHQLLQQTLPHPS
jgi:CheY-like chemotaxis protein